MADFASSAMVRILRAGMLQQGLQAPAAPVRGGTVTLAAKRQLLHAAVAQGGLAVLPHLGQGIHAIRGEAVHQALLPSRDAADLLARWGRLERYVHSRHRTAFESTGGTLVLQHLSLRAGEPPLPAESLVVLGVIVAALGEAGIRCTRVRIADVDVLPVTDAAGLARCVAQGRAHRWTLTLASAGTTLRRPASGIRAGTADWPTPAGELARWLAHDLAAPASLEQSAHALGLAPRSLQRTLAREGLQFSGVLARVRCDHAAGQLMHTARGVAEIGYLCGFADQAHFTRTFRRETALTPAAYRREFRARDGAGLPAGEVEAASGKRDSALTSLSTTLDRTCVTPGSRNAVSCRKAS